MDDTMKVRSDSSVVNYLRIRFLTRVWKNYSKQVEDGIRCH
jgi:hypothetical protein